MMASSYQDDPVANINFSDEKALEDFYPLPFPMKLWAVVSSGSFSSIWWYEDGINLAIDVELFKSEVLGRKKHLKLFEATSINAFKRQLSLYEFMKFRHDIERSASLNEFLTEEKSVSGFNKLQVYHHPFFKRDHPHLLGKMKLRLGGKYPPPLLPDTSSDRQQPNGKKRKAFPEADENPDVADQPCCSKQAKREHRQRAK